MLKALFYLVAFSLWTVTVSAESHPATFSYKLMIDDSGYDLRMTLGFAADVTLVNVKGGFADPQVLPQLAATVTAIKNINKDDKGFESIMTVKSFGISSQLLSKCEEQSSITYWHRSCVLDTGSLDGGKYMIWKNDDLNCRYTDENTVICEVVIKGKATAVKVMGIELASDLVFMMKAKYQAMENYAKMWMYVELLSTSAKLTNEVFEKSALKDNLKETLKMGLEVLKKGEPFSRSGKVTL